jgi:hypothetical protein
MMTSAVGTDSTVSPGAAFEGTRLRERTDVGNITVVATADLSGCVIVTGMPGAGKSTVTGLAARLLPKAAQVKGDDMNLMIQSGDVGWMEKPVAEPLRQDQLCNRTCAPWRTTSSTSVSLC